MCKKSFIYLFLALSFSVLFNSCDDVLNVRDATVINPDIWDDEESATLYLNDLYSNLPITTSITISSGAFGDHGNYCDETVGVNTFVNGEFTASSVGTFSDTYYSRVRFINIGLERMALSNMDEAAKQRIVGQLYFMRAWSYWNLVAIYGGIPYVKSSIKPFSDSVESMDVPRNKTSECIQYLCDDLDEAIANLPASVTEYVNGEDYYARFTRAAAAALKGRVLLFYASPQFNPDNDETRWENAYQANLEAKNIAEEDGYSLMTGLGTDAVNGSFASIFIEEGTSNKEALFVKPYDRAVGKTHSWDNSVRPFVAGVGGVDGGGQGNNPTWDLVKAFPMADGTAIDASGSIYDEGFFFLNRDPRFYATIAYNGCNWNTGGMTKVWSYQYSDTEDTKSTKTGFYCRKMTNSSLSNDLTDECGTDWIEIRFAEVLLNLAECANETNRQSEAISLVGQIRERAGIEAGVNNLYGLSSSYGNAVELTELILNERRIEFAFENKRFWDMRRRNMFFEDLGSTPKFNGVTRYIAKVSPKGLPPVPFLQPPFLAKLVNERDDIDLENNYTDYFTAKVEPYLGDVNYPIVIPETYKFFAIPQNILDRSQALKQTQGWGNGDDEFNPYE